MLGLWAVLMDGLVVNEPCAADAAGAFAAYHLARDVSAVRPASAVACVRLGEPETLRRFEGGRELAP